MIHYKRQYKNIHYGFVYDQNFDIADAKDVLNAQCPSTQWHSVNQSHSTEIHWVKSPLPTHADGIICEYFNEGCIIKTADCLPALIAGSKSFAILHAGWLGLRDQIIKKSIYHISQPQFCWIGPHHREYDRAINDITIPENFRAKAEITHNNKLQIRLKEIALHQLAPHPNIHIEDCNLCTHNDPRLPSYRNNDRNMYIFSYAIKLP